MMAGPAGDAGGAAAEEQTEFDVILKAAGASEDQRHQGGPRDHRSRPERSQGPRRSRRQSRQRRRRQGRSRRQSRASWKQLAPRSNSSNLRGYPRMERPGSDAWPFFLIQNVQSTDNADVGDTGSNGRSRRASNFWSRFTGPRSRRGPYPDRAHNFERPSPPRGWQVACRLRRPHPSQWCRHLSVRGRQ